MINVLVIGLLGVIGLVGLAIVFMGMGERNNKRK